MNKNGNGKNLRPLFGFESQQLVGFVEAEGKTGKQITGYEYAAGNQPCACWHAIIDYIDYFPFITNNPCSPAILRQVK